MTTLAFLSIFDIAFCDRLISEGNAIWKRSTDTAHMGFFAVLKYIQ